jgi:hypothetical protein
MSLNKAIASGKEKRKPYRGSAACDRSCRNGGSCPWCHSKRLHSGDRRRQAAIDDMREYERS